MNTTRTNKRDKETVRMAVLLPPDVRDRVAAVAASEGLAAGTWVRALIIRELERRVRRRERGGRDDV